VKNTQMLQPAELIVRETSPSNPKALAHVNRKQEASAAKAAAAAAADGASRRPAAAEKEKGEPVHAK